MFLPFWNNAAEKINKWINIKFKKIGGNMGQKLCWDCWKNIISGKIDSSNPNACDAYILQYAYMHRYKNINIRIKKLAKLLVLQV